MTSQIAWLRDVKSHQQLPLKSNCRKKTGGNSSRWHPEDARSRGLPGWSTTRGRWSLRRRIITMDNPRSLWKIHHKQRPWPLIARGCGTFSLCGVRPLFWFSAGRQKTLNEETNKTSCARGRHNMSPPPASWPVTFWLWKWCPSHMTHLCQF